MTADAVALSWSWEPLTVFVLGLGAALYFRGLRRIHPVKVRVILWWRPLLFYTGLVIILLALISPLDTLGRQLFTFHMIQHMLLTHVGIPLLLLGAPVLPILRGMPHGLRRAAIAPLSRFLPSRYLAHLLTHPLVSWPLFVGFFWVWHLPELYSAAIANDFVHILQHTTFLATAFLFWWSVIDPVPMAGRLPYLGRFLYVILALTQGLPLASLLTFSQSPLFAPYIAGGGLWGIDPATDQQIGGLIMWIVSMVSYFITIGILFVVAMTKDEQNVRRAEALAAAQASG